MTKKTMIVVLTLAVLAGAAGLIYRNFSGGGAGFALDIYQALGAGVGEETAKLLGRPGQVLVLALDTSEFPNPVVESELNSFQQTLANRGRARATPVRFKLTPRETMAAGGAVPGDRLLQELQNHPNVGAVVLFCGFPPLSGPGCDALKQSGAKFVVASGYLPAYRNLLNAGVIHLAIVPRFDRSATPAKEPGTLREWFDREFLVITPDRTASLPY